MLGLKLIHVSKRGHRELFHWQGLAESLFTCHFYELLISYMLLATRISFCIIKTGQLTVPCNVIALRWRNNEHEGVSNHQPRNCLFKRSFERWSKRHQSPAWQAFTRGIPWSPVNSPHKRPVTQKMSPFDDVIMTSRGCCDEAQLAV